MQLKTASITPGKLAGLGAISNPAGVIAALALDQRGSLAAIMADAAGQTPSPAMLREFKGIITCSLTPEASAILLDLELGSAAAASRAAGCGLILTYERDAYVNRTLHRIPELIPNLSVERLRDAGGNAVKLLLHYSVEAPEAVNGAKRRLVEKVGAECVARDVAFLLEVLAYDAEGGDEKSFEYARRKPDLAARNAAEFSKPEYAVDVLKIEMPVNMKYVAGTQAHFEHLKKSGAATPSYSRAEAMGCFRNAAAAALKPFIYLSAGVAHAEFIEGLGLAAESGVPFSGVLCGRAIWQTGARVYAQKGGEALERWIGAEGLPNLQSVMGCLKSAQPWQARA